jgi:peptidoglycan/LPS O-acetylase OafA/YrhL
VTNVITRLDTAPPVQPVNEQNRRPVYRRDIDGLRALAILSVVAYHLSTDLVPGGFLGVDVFFVISGFLISTIIFKSLDNNGFSFIEFYAHRIRRIFPALILVVGCSFFVGRYAMLPNEFVLFGKHIIASTCFFENYRLWQEAGYFDIATSLKPLMHLWSLAIEEQFYIIFPLLVWGAWRLRLNLLVVVGLIFAASFITYLHNVVQQPIAAFFGPKARFWELMVGAILAHALLHSGQSLNFLRAYRFRIAGAVGSATLPFSRHTGTAKSTISVAGLFLVGLVITGLNQHLPLASTTGEVFAVLGASMLIFSGPTALVNRVLLASRPAVFIGLISYPLYLWHWPLLSFLTIVEGTLPSFSERALAVASSFILAFLTYRFVERPIRQNRNRHTKIAAGLVAGSAGLILLGAFSRHLVPSYDDATKKIMQAWVFSGYSEPDGLYLDKEYQYLALGHNENNKIALIGDSHAIQYKQAFAGALKRSTNELPEILFVTYLSAEELARIPPTINKILNDKTVKTVILSEFWAIKRGSAKINYAIRCCGTGLMQILGEGHRPAPLNDAQIQEANKSLEKEITALKQSGKQVYVVLDNPFGEELAPRSLLNRSFFSKITIDTKALLKSDAIERDEPTRSAIEKIALDTGAKIIDPIKYLCDQSICPALSHDGSPIYKDYDHLSLNAVTHEVRYLDFIVSEGLNE